MTDDLRDEIHVRAALLPVPEADIGEVLSGGRRALRRRRAAAISASIATAAVVWVAVANVSLEGGGDRGGMGPAAGEASASPDGWTTYRDPDEGYSVTYPADWHRASENLTPHVEDPEEMLSVASFELRPGGDSGCAFGRAYEDFGPTDAFVSISESSGDLTSRYMVTRPADFAYDQGYEPTFAECLETEPVFDDRFIPFRDGDRFFYAYVAVGKAASDQARHEALQTLNSLSFED